MNMEVFKLFLLIFVIGLLCSAIPMGYIGMIFGSIAVLVNSIILTILLKKGLLK